MIRLLLKIDISGDHDQYHCQNPIANSGGGLFFFWHTDPFLTGLAQQSDSSFPKEEPL